MAEGLTRGGVDRRDWALALVTGVVAVAVKAVALTQPAWRMGEVDGFLPCLIVVGYIVYRARREPEKLDTWGLTTPLRAAAVWMALAMLLAGVAALAGFAFMVAKGLTWEGRYVTAMVQYLAAAFLQQFFMCSVGIVTLEQVRMLQGRWRIPLVVGLIFAAAHFWTPHRIPGTFIPVQVPLTFPVGFLVSWYFLRFRTIVPLVVLHAILYVLLNRWVEAHL